MTDFGGLWYEYIYSQDYAEGSDRECATWNLLAHNNNGTGEATVYDLLHHSMNQTANTTKFARQAMICGESDSDKLQECHYYETIPAQDDTTYRPKEFSIIQTDQF